MARAPDWYAVFGSGVALHEMATYEAMTVNPSIYEKFTSCWSSAHLSSLKALVSDPMRSMNPVTVPFPSPYLCPSLANLT